MKEVLEQNENKQEKLINEVESEAKKDPKKQKVLLRVKDVSLIALFASFIVVCSWISIPFVVPFTLQTFAVFLALIVLGGLRGTLSILTYILLGIIGLPVFANFNGGFAYLIGPTGGYIVGFLLTGLLMWALEKPFSKKNDGFLIISMLLGLIVCYACGTIWFRIVYLNKGNDITIMKVLFTCVIPFIIPDILKIVVALVIKNKLKKLIKIE